MFERPTGPLAADLQGRVVWYYDFSQSGLAGSGEADGSDTAQVNKCGKV